MSGKKLLKLQSSPFDWPIKGSVGSAAYPVRYCGSGMLEEDELGVLCGRRGQDGVVPVLEAESEAVASYDASGVKEGTGAVKEDEDNCGLRC